MTQKHRTNRRTYMKTLGVLGATGLGSTGLVTAKGKGNGKIPLGNRPMDILLYWSEVGADGGDQNDPDELDDFGYLPPRSPDPPGGLFYKAHNPEEGGLFDFSKIEMTPNGGNPSQPI